MTQSLTGVDSDCDRTVPLSSTSHSDQFIADLIGSSCYQAVSDDALKDEDNVGWVLELEPAVREEWIDRIRWIRLIDRLAEHEMLHPQEPAFRTFLADWQSLIETGAAPLVSAYHTIFDQIRSRWFSSDGKPTEPAPLWAWQRYIEAIARYHTSTLEIDSLDQYETMLEDLAGSFFQVLPFLTHKHRQAATYFGILDQFYNHLRDLHEDAQQGICYLPNELLNRFGMSRTDILEQRACGHPNYQSMMLFWLEDYLPRLRRKARQLMTAVDLHPSWRLMRDWSIYRYRRIELVFRECDFDYTQFGDRYWQRVRADLPILLEQVRENSFQKPPSSTLLMLENYGQLRGWKKLVLAPQTPLLIDLKRVI